MTEIDPNGILEMLPHRYPFLMIDRVVDVVPGERVVAIKCVTANEPFFAGHFPGNPVMPGVLIVEAMAQAAAVLGMETFPENRDGGVLLLGMDKVRFRRQVVPGDTLRLEVVPLRLRGSIWKVHGEATVSGERAAEADLLATFTREES